MKKILIGIAGLLAVLAVLFYMFRDEVGFGLMRMALEPNQSFSEDTRHAAPDYTQALHWAALPERSDDADVSPVGFDLDNQDAAAVDVFFIHPTTYYKPDYWNQPLDDIDANTFTDTQVLRNQASVFNSCCRIYAPRYRQATLYAFMDDGDDGDAAIDFAYADVRNAFEYYLQNYNNGRPFIIAGHSQGGKHADTLLKEINGTQLMEQLVAAYPIGFFFDGKGSIPVCEHATQTGCQVTWNSVAPDAPTFSDTSESICVNPLNWSASGKYADFSENQGAVSFAANGEVEPGIADAQCVNGLLHVTDVKSENYSTEMFGPGNYHVYDFSFFHMNIRNNALTRVQAFTTP
jgi:hypothetical protein